MTEDNKTPSPVDHSGALVTHIRPATDSDPICYAWQVCASSDDGAQPVFETTDGRLVSHTYHPGFLEIAKVAGSLGISYPTNAAMQAFIVSIFSEHEREHQEIRLQDERDWRAKIDHVKAEVKRLSAELHNAHLLRDSLRRDMDSLREKLKSGNQQKDALRYQHIRANHVRLWSGLGGKCASLDIDFEGKGDDLDAAIDAAMELPSLHTPEEPQ